MRTPGVSVRPIITLDGRLHLAEVSFDGVCVPVTNLIGEQDQGWAYSKQLLNNERIWYAHVEEKRHALRRIRVIAVAFPDDATPEFRRRLNETEIAVSCLQSFVERALREASGNVASLINILATETAQAITELLLSLTGGLAPPYIPKRNTGWQLRIPDIPNYIVPAVEEYLMARAQTIYGGTSEIQKTIISKSVLGP